MGAKGGKGAPALGGTRLSGTPVEPVKLLIAVVESEFVPRVRTSLAEQGLSATFVASSGGFLRHGNTTFFVALEDERVDEVLSTLRAAIGGPTQRQGRTVHTNVFVVPMAEFEKV
jgi:uncharacterized protein YaaQ